MHQLVKGLIVLVVGAAAVGTGAVAIGYSSAPGSCTYPTSGMGEGLPGTGGFAIEVTRDGQPVAEYEPGITYTVTLEAPQAYRGFLLQSVAGAPGAPNQNGVGTFVDFGVDYANGPCAVPGSSVGHALARRNAPVASDSFQWVAPPAGTGPVSFHAIGVYSRFVWHGEQDLIVTTLGEAGTVDGVAESWSTLKARFD